MAGRVRPDKQRDVLEAEARRMRAEGRTMHEIAAELNVPASTLYRWAAENNWRGRDLALEAWQSAYVDNEPDRVRKGAKIIKDGPPAVKASLPQSKSCQERGREEPDGSEHQEKITPLTSADLKTEANKCLLAATRLTQAGQLKQAEAALRLAERFAAAADTLNTEAPAKPDYDPKKELERRLLEYEARELRAQRERERARAEGRYSGTWN